MSDATLNLFVIEDDDVDYKAIERALKKANIWVNMTRAKDGHEAVLAIDTQPVPKSTIFLVDLQMPRLNGIEFLYRLRKSARYHDSVVMVLSTSDDPGDIFDCYRCQIAAYFEKSKLCADYEPLARFLDIYESHVKLPFDYL